MKERHLQGAAEQDIFQNDHLHADDGSSEVVLNIGITKKFKNTHFNDDDVVRDQISDAACGEDDATRSGWEEHSRDGEEVVEGECKQV